MKEHREQICYDTQAGRLVLGQRALQISMEQSGIGDIVPLADLLKTEQFPYTVHDYEKLDVRSWERDDYIASGKFILKMITNDDNPYPAVTVEHLRRMYFLGLGPEYRYYAGRKNSPFASIPEFQEAVGSKVNSRDSQFEDWALDDFTRYAGKLMRKLGRLPAEADYIDNSRNGMNPGMYAISRYGGGLRIINESLGFPNVLDWSRRDYLSWGVKVLQANPGRELTTAMCTILSGRRRGPSDVTVSKYFDSWQQFKYEAYEVYRQHAYTEQTKLQEYRSGIKAGTLPQEYKDLSDSELLHRAGRFTLAAYCLPDATAEQLREMAYSKKFMADLVKARPALSAGIIETDAVVLGVYDDVWPDTNHLDYLYVSDEELAEFHNKKAVMKRQWNKQRPGSSGQPE